MYNSRKGLALIKQVQFDLALTLIKIYKVPNLQNIISETPCSCGRFWQYLWAKLEHICCC
jgi:hypothetical protein